MNRQTDRRDRHKSRHTHTCSHGPTRSRCSDWLLHIDCNERPLTTYILVFRYARAPANSQPLPSSHRGDKTLTRGRIDHLATVRSYRFTVFHPGLSPRFPSFILSLSAQKEHFLSFDVKLWLMTSIYEYDLKRVNVNHHVKGHLFYSSRINWHAHTELLQNLAQSKLSRQQADRQMSPPGGARTHRWADKLKT